MVPTAYVWVSIFISGHAGYVMNLSQSDHGNAGNVFSFVFGSEMQFLAAKKQRFMFCHSAPLMSPSIAFFGPNLLLRIR
jgi:hypothetical protein